MFALLLYQVDITLQSKSDINAKLRFVSTDGELAAQTITGTIILLCGF